MRKKCEGSNSINRRAQEQNFLPLLLIPSMSITMSGTIPNDWLNFYQQSFPGSDQLIPSSVSEATTVTTIAAQAQLSPEGRVSKPIKRRSRASRRTPTTLLNTDTTNFRAMVQQFTGAPSAPDHLFGPRPLPVNPNGLMLAPSQSLQHQHLYHQQQQQQHYPAYTQGGDNVFYQRLSNNPTATATATATATGPNNVSDDRVGVFVEHGGRFFPATSSS